MIMKVIITRADAYHVPNPDLREYGADFCCITELLGKDFIKQAAERGTFIHLDTGRVIEGYESIRTSISYGRYGVIYAYDGTISEFLKTFSRIDGMSEGVKLCPYCREYFVSPPAEWYMHILRHIAAEKRDFQRESFSYYFGPD